MPSSPTSQAPAPAAVTNTSFGYLHNAPPEGAHLIIDVRAHFRDPHVDPRLRYLDATDSRLCQAVLETPGTWKLVLAASSAIRAFLDGPGAGEVLVAVGCSGGRHRAPSIATAIGDTLNGWGTAARVQHRDMAKPVVTRDAGSED
jgi:RNase adaptor protein for sRNA GlmZ degradation